MSTLTATTTFEPGIISATRALLDHAEESAIPYHAYLNRHLAGDWGDVCEEDAQANLDALASGARIVSVYRSPDGGHEDVLIITDAETEVCAACWTGRGSCDPSKGETQGGMHFRTDLPARRLTTTLMLRADY